jgi:hypothetical protein
LLLEDEYRAAAGAEVLHALGTYSDAIAFDVNGPTEGPGSIIVGQQLGGLQPGSIALALEYVGRTLGAQRTLGGGPHHDGAVLHRQRIAELVVLFAVRRDQRLVEDPSPAALHPVK